MPAARGVKDQVREQVEQEKVEKGWLIGRWVVSEWVWFEILLSMGWGVASFTRSMFTNLSFGKSIHQLYLQGQEQEQY